VGGGLHSPPPHFPRYEQDWLDDEFDGSKWLLQNATAATTWMSQMNNGCTNSNVTIQMCMSHVRHILQSLAMPAVTNARASGDYHVSCHPEIWQRPVMLGCPLPYRWWLCGACLFCRLLAFAPALEFRPLAHCRRTLCRFCAYIRARLPTCPPAPGLFWVVCLSASVCRMCAFVGQRGSHRVPWALNSLSCDGALP